MAPSVNAIGGTLSIVALAVVFYLGTPPTVPITVPAPAQVLQPPVPVPLVKKPSVYHRVVKDGKIDGAVKCKWVPKVAYLFSKDRVLAAAKEYGLSPAQISALRACLN